MICRLLLATLALTLSASLRTEKRDGISFLVKSCEEPTLTESVTSLRRIKVPHEIIIVIHHCMGIPTNQTSMNIAYALQAQNPTHIKIFEYAVQISRPGYETLITPADSPRSLIRYHNWALNLTNYKWVAKWDADFIMPPSLYDWIHANAATWSRTNEVVILQARNNQTTEIHPYFSSCITHYMKDIFYEMAYQRILPDSHVQHRLPADIFIYHKSDYAHIKPYWLTPPWFETENTEEAAYLRMRYRHVINRYGPFPGYARSGNTYPITLLGNQIISTSSFVEYQ